MSVLPPPGQVEIYEAVTPQSFDAIKAEGRPAVLKGLSESWPLVRAGRSGAEAVKAHLLPHEKGRKALVFEAGPQADGFFSYREDVLGFDFERKDMTVSALMDILRRDVDRTVYAGGINIPRTLPSLEAELSMPLLPQSEERLVSLWLGGRTRIPAHWDLPQNIAVCVAGRRRFTLFPTEAVPDLYIGPLDRTIAGQPSSLVDYKNPDLQRFPRYARAAEKALAAELEPGDALYLPSLWLHGVESLEGFGALVNFWWRDGPAHLITPLFTLLHAQLTLKGMPQKEKEAWRVLFEHFVFGEGDPAPHLSEAAKGILGDQTPERLAWLRQAVARPLTR